MHVITKILILLCAWSGFLIPLDQLPSEIIKKIVSLEIENVLALSTTSTITRKACIAWAQDCGALFLNDAENGYTERHVKFILQHNKKITNDQFAESVIEFVRSLIKKSDTLGYGRVEDQVKDQVEDQKENFLKSRFQLIGNARPFAVHVNTYNNKKFISCEEIEMFTELGFVLPFIYHDNKSIPLMHYLVEKHYPKLAVSMLYKKNLFALLLQQGMNPFFMHDEKNVLDLLQENTCLIGPHSLDCKEFFIDSCKSNARTPNDPQVLMYHHGKPLSIEAIKKQIHGE